MGQIRVRLASISECEAETRRYSFPACRNFDWKFGDRLSRSLHLRRMHSSLGLDRTVGGRKPLPACLSAWLRSAPSAYDNRRNHLQSPLWILDGLCLRAERWPASKDREPN